MELTREEKQLLLRDLCARLPYGVEIRITSDECDDGFRAGEFDNTLRYHHLEAFVCDRIEIKPYLRPISSMTEEELFEFIRISDSVLRIGERKSTCVLSLEQIDWLNARGFDYRGLIEKGLALEAREDMYKNR
jgi:hypothetical protein